MQAKSLLKKIHGPCKHTGSLILSAKQVRKLSVNALAKHTHTHVEAKIKRTIPYTRTDAAPTYLLSINESVASAFPETPYYYPLYIGTYVVVYLVFPPIRTLVLRLSLSLFQSVSLSLSLSSGRARVCFTNFPQAAEQTQDRRRR